MKVLSLLQPWATLVVNGHKKIETRSWNAKHRGPLLVHASKKLSGEQIRLGQKFNMLHGAGLGFIDDLPVGQIIGIVDLIHVVQSEYCFKDNEFIVDNCTWKLTESERAFGDYSPGRYGWLLKNPVQFETPIPAKGSLGLWEYNGPIPFELTYNKEIERSCRVCGCTDRDCRQCVEKTGSPCHWVSEDLCSACV
jgi:hypothetical protein